MFDGKKSKNTNDQVRVYFYYPGYWWISHIGSLTYFRYTEKDIEKDKHIYFFIMYVSSFLSDCVYIYLVILLLTKHQRM